LSIDEAISESPEKENDEGYRKTATDPLLNEESVWSGASASEIKYTLY